MNDLTTENRSADILLVDDSVDILKLLNDLLSYEGYSTRQSTAGEEALEIVRSSPPDLILLDIRMPGMDGLEVCRHLKSEDDSRDIPVIFISGLADERDKVEGFKAGGVDYISKPIRPVEVLARVKTHLKVRDRSRKLARSNKELQKAYDELKVAQSRILQQDKMASIGQLAAGVAHEINNPMGFILSNLHTLDKYLKRLIEFQNAQETVITQLTAHHDDEKDVIGKLKDLKSSLKISAVREDIVDLLEESVEGGERIKEIVQNLKSFARGEDKDQRSRADINQCIESTLNIVWNELKYNCTVVKDYADIPLIHCNPGQINQVFMNLLVNAAHAIKDQGEITITTRSENDSVTIIISDNGCGIPADNLQRIFEPFFTTKDVGKGTGLGLSIAYDIVKNHHGEITVDSEVGKGSRFAIVTSQISLHVNS